MKLNTDLYIYHVKQSKFANTGKNFDRPDILKMISQNNTLNVGKFISIFPFQNTSSTRYARFCCEY